MSSAASVKELAEQLEIYHTSHTMWDLIMYLCAVLTYILLYWFHKPKPDSASSQSPSSSKRSSASPELHYGQSKSLEDSPDPNRGVRSKIKSRLASTMKRRKELVEHDILLNLGVDPDSSGFESFCDRFGTFQSVSQALVNEGFCSCDVVIGIDFTASNEWQGKRSFNKTSLHKTNGSKIYNPYQKVLQILGKTLSFISNDHMIHPYGFGDELTKDHSVFPLCKEKTAFSDYQHVIDVYTQATKSIKLSGPTNLAPIINKAIEYCAQTGNYHVLITILDGQVSSHCESQTVDAIVQASNYPLSIIAIGIGDGPFGTMFEYDDGLPKRKFDNFQFVNFHRTVTKSKHEILFALHALMELPDQYKAMQQLDYFSKSSSRTAADDRKSK